MEVGLFNLFCVIVSLIAIIAYWNSQYSRLPTTMAILLGSLALSGLVLLAGKLGFTDIELQFYKKIIKFDFYKFLMDIALNFMLFASALSVNTEQFLKAKTEVFTLAFLSTLISAAIISFGLYGLLALLHIPISIYGCLLFGALISPTDPIAVLALFKTVKVEPRIGTIMAGESLINDGVGIVIFTICYQLAFFNLEPSLYNVFYLFLIKFIGGIFVGAILGSIARYTFKNINNIKVEFIISLAVVMGGYLFAEFLTVSSPITMVTAGIMIKYTHQYQKQDLYKIWEMIDDIFNAILFFLLGIELIVISHNYWSLLMSLMAIIMVLLARFISVYIPIISLNAFKTYPPNTCTILSWGGLRGGLAVALALALPEFKDKSILLTMTYSVVIFSMIVQGLSLKPLLLKRVPL